MKYATLGQLRSHPREVVKRAQTDDVVITDRGKPTARLVRLLPAAGESPSSVPPSSSLSGAIDALQAAAVASGACDLTHEEIDAEIEPFGQRSGSARRETSRGRYQCRPPGARMR